jgi:hypothetical protein
MPSISLDFVESLAPSAGALDNARSLVKKGALEGLSAAQDGSLIFASCQGSGKLPYSISADLARPEKPVLRCSCPSRQLPCKHSLALLLAYAAGQRFAVREAPPELIAKREAAATKERRAAEKVASGAEAKPKKANASALKKKIEAQIAGLESLSAEILRLGATGVGALTPEALAALEAQAKKLGDAYLPGPQLLLRRLAASAAEGGEEGRRRAVDELCMLRSLAKKGLERCRARLEDPEHALDPESAIDEWLGHAWQLSELEAAGLVRANAELLQLAFTVYDDEVKKEYCDSGLWLDLADGRILETRNLRPYKALKHLKAEDSFFRVAAVPQLCVYPGGLNPRARWDAMGDREAGGADYARALGLAEGSLAEACKKARTQMKSALLPPCPALLLRFARIGTVGPHLAAEDSSGSRIELADGGGYPEATTRILALLDGAELEDGALLARFWQDGERLAAQPLAIVGSGGLRRLGW